MLKKLVSGTVMASAMLLTSCSGGTLAAEEQKAYVAACETRDFEALKSYDSIVAVGDAKDAKAYCGKLKDHWAKTINDVKGVTAEAAKAAWNAQINAIKGLKEATK